MQTPASMIPNAPLKYIQTNLEIIWSFNVVVVVVRDALQEVRHRKQCIL